MSKLSAPTIATLAAGLACGAPSASAQQSAEKDSTSVRTKLTTVAGSEGDLAQLAELTFNGVGFRGKAALESLPSNRLFSENLNMGLSLSLDAFGASAAKDQLPDTLNIGAGLRRGELDLSRFSFRHSFTPRAYLGGLVASTPNRTQYAAEAGLGLSDEISLQGVVDEQGDARMRFLYQGADWGVSLGGGVQNGEAVYNASLNTDCVWAVLSGGEAQPTAARLVFGNIPPNRSALYGEFSRPGANDLSIFPDQTVRTSIGANPSFGLMPAQAPDAFLGPNPGDLVFDFQFVEDRIVTSRLVGRLGNLGSFHENWLSGGVGRKLDSETNFGAVELGTKIGPSSVRVRGECDEHGNSSLGLYFSVEF